MNTDQYYRKCLLCPRKCGVNRLAGQKGYCKVTSNLKLSRAALHFWEEPCISGEKGSGAVFFSGCNMGCVFCQNQDISHGESGIEVPVSRLAEIFLELQDQGAHNINLVTPDHYAPTVVQALDMAGKHGLHLPVICNCSGYMDVEVLKLFEGYVDIWLPDLKYNNDATAIRYSNAPGYTEIAHRAIAEMYRQCGDPIFDDDGMIRKGMIVRHLILPGYEDESKGIIRYLYETYGDHIYVSIMNQFTPLPHLLPRYPELNRKISDEIYDEVVDYAIDLGIENGFIQEGETASDSFIPAFDNEGVLKCSRKQIKKQ